MSWLSLQAELDQLADEHRQYQAIFEQAEQAYLVSDASGTIREVNGAAVDILQRRRRHLQGKALAAFIALERRAEFRERLAKLCSGEAAADGAWRTIVESPGLRTEVTLTARLIGPREAARGVCWRLESVA